MVPIEQKTRSQNRLVTVILVIVIMVGFVFIASDWEEMRLVLERADWRYIPLVLMFTALSYGFYSFAYAVVAKTLDIKMRKRELAEVCFISTVINHVLTSGGVVGYSLRYLLMKMYNVSLRDVLTSSFLHFYLTSLDMLIILPMSIVYFIQNSAAPRVVDIALGVMFIIFGLLLLISTFLVIFPSRRRPILSLLVRTGRRFTRKEWVKWLIQLDETLTCGTKAFYHKPLLLLGVILLTLADFICSIIAMNFVFVALGSTIKASVLTSGYVIGIMAGLLSMVPGGLGVQEGSMASIYAFLGVPFRQAVLAAVLFRILYFLLPYLLILPFYNRLLDKAKLQAHLY